MERLRRWRLLLGSEGKDLGDLSSIDQKVENTLAALYDSPKKGSLGPSQPNINRWLGDVRKYFPSTVVSVMQRDAIERLGMVRMLLEPETLRAVQPDVQLAATLLSLSHQLPPKAREAARAVVRSVVENIADRISFPVAQKVGRRRASPRSHASASGVLDFDRTIRANLKNAQPDGRLVIERCFSRPRGGRALKRLIIAMDQSESMSTSLIYGGIYASVLASLPALEVRAFAFSTDIVDLSEMLHDPVEMLFSVRLGGGTDIAQALQYANQMIEFPGETLIVLLTDLYEGGSSEKLLKSAKQLVGRGVRLVSLLALSDDGEPAFDHAMAQAIANLGVPVFACTPDAFPEQLAIALS